MNELTREATFAGPDDDVTDCMLFIEKIKKVEEQLLILHRKVHRVGLPEATSISVPT